MLSKKDKAALEREGWIPIVAKENGYLVVVYVKGENAIIGLVQKIGPSKGAEDDA